MARCGPSFVRARERSIRTTNRKNAATKVGCRAVLSLLITRNLRVGTLKRRCWGCNLDDAEKKAGLMVPILSNQMQALRKGCLSWKPDQWITTKGEPVTTLNAQKEPRDDGADQRSIKATLSKDLATNENVGAKSDQVVVVTKKIRLPRWRKNLMNADH